MKICIYLPKEVMIKSPV